MTSRLLILPAVLLLLVVGDWRVRADAAGPWRGQVFDAETGQPLEGVVVLAVWEKRSPGIIHDRVEFHDADEAVTDAEGRFLLPARSLSMPNPFVEIRGPRVYMFKPGYGERRFRGELDWLKLGSIERDARYAEARKRLEGDGTLFELPPLKSREERLRSMSMPPLVPDGRMPRYLEAIRRERRSMGLQP